MNSANARDCLLHLARAKLSEREDLVRLNDQFVDIIEHFHYVEAEHSALEHDYNLLKTGVQSDSSGINEIFESEIRNVKVGIEEVIKNRQHLLAEQNLLSQQVNEAEQQWRHTANAALGVPKDVDEEFKRICQIRYEDCLTKRRIKYMEEKNRVIKQNSGRIFEQINLMRMRKDQAVSLKQEYILRKNELLNSIRNLEEDNKKIIMNEHKYFTRDRNADRHVFRDQLRQAIADIRADYEFKRVKNEEEIRIRLEREISRLNNNKTVSITWDRLRDELSNVKTSFSDLQHQLSQVEIRNATLSQQIELNRLEISENHQSFEISLDAKIKEIEKLREQCTKISVELEKLCDLNIDLEKEITTYRRLLDQSGSVNAHGPSATVVASALNRQSDRLQQERHTARTSSITHSTTESIGRTAQALPPTQTYQDTYIRQASPIRSTYSPYREESSSIHSSNSVINTHIHPYTPAPIAPISVAPTPITPLPAPTPLSRTPIPIPDPPTIPLPPTPRASSHVAESAHHHESSSSSHIHTPYRPYSPIGLRRTYDDHTYDRIPSEIGSGVGIGYGRVGNGVQMTDHTRHSGQTEIGQYSPRRYGEGLNSHRQSTISQTHVTSPPRASTNFPPLPSIDEVIRTGYDTVDKSRNRNYSGVGHTTDHSLSSSHNDTTHNIQHFSPTPKPSKLEASRNYVETHVGESSSTDSVDEDNFQRFTRWYKGRVKISDVTPDFVQLVNRSSKKSADIGGFKLIHEFGHRSVYVDLPTGLILKPKDSLKIYARSAHHEYGAVVADIDLFDTTIHTNTSIRNTNNEVKSWFVYTSNTEIGDAVHHHH